MIDPTEAEQQAMVKEAFQAERARGCDCEPLAFVLVVEDDAGVESLAVRMNHQLGCALRKKQAAHRN